MAKNKKVMESKTGYDLASSTYDKKLSYLNSFEKNQVLPILGDLKNKTVLDVGAGTGRLSIMLEQAQAKVTALDVSEGMLKILHQKNKRIITVIGEAESLPFEDNSFDIITAAFLIVHLKNPKLFFDEAYRVLKDGGQLLVTNINQKDPPVVSTKEGDIVIESYYHRPEAIREMLADLAFTIAEEKIIKENDLWVNQIILAQK